MSFTIKLAVITNSKKIKHAIQITSLKKLLNRTEILTN